MARGFRTSSILIVATGSDTTIINYKHARFRAQSALSYIALVNVQVIVQSIPFKCQPSAHAGSLLFAIMVVLTPQL